MLCTVCDKKFHSKLISKLVLSWRPPICNNLSVGRPLNLLSSSHTSTHRNNRTQSTQSGWIALATTATTSFTSTLQAERERWMGIRCGAFPSTFWFSIIKSYIVCSDFLPYHQGHNIHYNSKASWPSQCWQWTELLLLLLLLLNRSEKRSVTPGKIIGQR